jgi:hypothetical protein
MARFKYTKPKHKRKYPMGPKPCVSGTDSTQHLRRHRLGPTKYQVTRVLFEHTTDCHIEDLAATVATLTHHTKLVVRNLLQKIVSGDKVERMLNVPDYYVCPVVLKADTMLQATRIHLKEPDRCMHGVPCVVQQTIKALEQASTGPRSSKMTFRDSLVFCLNALEDNNEDIVTSFARKCRENKWFASFADLFFRDW